MMHPEHKNETNKARQKMEDYLEELLENTEEYDDDLEYGDGYEM